MAENSHSFVSYFKRMSSPIIVLSVLREQPMYGYEISSLIQQRTEGRYTVSVMYPILYRLEEQGYIEVARQEVVDNRVRNYYRLTEAGRAYLERTLALSDYYVSFYRLMNTMGMREYQIDELNKLPEELKKKREEAK